MIAKLKIAVALTKRDKAKLNAALSGAGAGGGKDKTQLQIMNNRYEDEVGDSGGGAHESLRKSSAKIDSRTALSEPLIGPALEFSHAVLSSCACSSEYRVGKGRSLSPRRISLSSSSSSSSASREACFGFCFCSRIWYSTDLLPDLLPECDYALPSLQSTCHTQGFHAVPLGAC